jgi:hypothetical protein
MFLAGKLKEMDRLEAVGGDEKIIFRWLLKKHDMIPWTGFVGTKT